MLKDTDYLYITARIRVQETNLLTADDYRKMASSTTGEAVKILSAHGYPVTAEEANIPHFADALVAKQRGELFAMLKKDAPNSEYFNFFLYPEDYLNIKVLLKSTADATAVATLSQEGTVPAEEMKTAVEIEDFSALTPLMAKAIEEGKKAYAESRDPQSIDLVADTFCFADMARLAQESEDAFLQEYVKKLIDIANVKAFFRLKKMGKNLSFAENVFAEGGSVEKAFYGKQYENALDEAEKAFKQTPVASLVQLAMPLTGLAGGMGKLEKELDLVVLSLAEKGRRSPFGANALASFLIAKEIEFKNIRIIMAGLSADVEPEAIMERVRVNE